jgi:hypothetical protein
VRAMNKHAYDCDHDPILSKARTRGSGSLLGLKREILGLLAIAAVMIATVSLSSCAGVTSAAGGGGGTNPGTPGTGILSPNSTSLNFGSVAVGTSKAQSVSVTNTGTASVDVSQATASGSGFSIMSGNSPTTVAVGQSVTVQVQFAPQAAGPATGNLSVMSNAPNTPLTVALSGTGAQGGLTISPASLSFNNIVVGQSSTQNATLTNGGNASITLTAAQSSGAGFSVTGLSLPLTLNAGQSAAFGVQFRPTSASVISGSVSFTDNAAGSPQTLTLSASAVNASSTLSANPGTVNFSNVLVGNTNAQTVSLTNSGTAAVTISLVNTTGTGFSVSGVTAGQQIAAGASASFTATFAPTSAGAASGSVTISSNATDSAVSVAFSGTGTQGSLAANPSSVNFGSVLVGSNKPVSVTLSNPGSAPVSVTAASITGTGFTLAGLAAQTLNPGQTSSFTVTFTPGSAGSASGTVSITSNAPGSPLRVDLSGSGTATAAQMSINPPALAFNSVAVGSSTTQTVTVNNTGNAALNITAAGISGSGYTTNLSAPVTIGAGAMSTFTVTYAPTSEGSASGSVSLTSNAPGSPATIGLSGTGLQAQPAANPTTASFSSVAVGSSNSQPITLRNNGNTTLTISQVTVTGSGFSVTGISTSTTIGAGASGTFNAVFTPTSGGSVNGSVVLTTNGAPSQLTITLSGTGAATTQSLSFSPATLNFGTVAAGQSSSLPTVLTNTGNSNVTISGVTVSGTGFSGSGIGSGLILTPGQTATLTVQFAPTATGVDNGTVGISSNATNSPAVSLSGSSHSAALSWAASRSTVNGYNVYRATSSGAYGGSPLNSSPVPGTAFTDPTVIGGQTYYYVVRSVESGVESINSGEVQAVIPTP